jgi:hypothetical protein
MARKGYAAACGFTDVALPMASWLREAVDCRSVNNPTRRSPGAIVRFIVVLLVM